MHIKLILTFILHSFSKPSTNFQLVWAMTAGERSDNLGCLRFFPRLRASCMYFYTKRSGHRYWRDQTHLQRFKHTHTSNCWNVWKFLLCIKTFSIQDKQDNLGYNRGVIIKQRIFLFLWGPVEFVIVEWFAKHSLLKLWFIRACGKIQEQIWVQQSSKVTMCLRGRASRNLSVREEFVKGMSGMF